MLILRLMIPASQMLLIFIVGFLVGSRKFFNQGVPKAYFFQYPSMSLTDIPTKNLIITVLLDLSLQNTYQFVRSARSSCNDCHIILMISTESIIDDDFLELAKIYSVTYIPYDMWTPKDAADILPSIRTVSLRWIVLSRYLQYLNKINTRYRHIFICDSRDVIFQKNVFDYINHTDDALFVFQEGISMTIEKCSYNSKWIRDCYGQATLDRIGGRPIICAGTILGSWNAMLNYLSLVELITMKRYNECNDQGIHNHIIYVDDVKNTTIRIITNEQGFIGTLGYSKRVRNKFGLILNENREVYAVVHQFDRSEKIKEQFDIQYQLWSTNI